MVQRLASRAAVARGTAGWHMGRVRCVDEIAAVVDREAEVSAGRRMGFWKKRLWKKQAGCRKPSAFETCRRGAWLVVLSVETAIMHCSFFSQDHKNTRWRKLDIKRERNDCASRKSNGASLIRIGTAQPP
jgi:hypothetical protein